MRDILVFLADEGSSDEVRKIFSGESYKVSIVSDAENVIEHCQLELFDLALVWPATAAKTSELLTLLESAGFDYVPVMAVIREDQNLQQLVSLPIVDLVKMPMPTEAFFEVLERAIEDVDIQSKVVDGMNWQGSVAEYNLIDLIQMIESGQQDSELIMRFGRNSGHVFFKKGKLIDAVFNDQRGIPALEKLAFWPIGHFETRLAAHDSADENISQNNQEILMRLVEQLLENETHYAALPELLDEVAKNPFFHGKDLTPLQKRIAGICEKPISIFEILVTLTERNEELLPELVNMLQINLLGTREEIETLVREEQSRSGFEKFFSSLSSVFKKRNDGDEGEYYYDDGSDDEDNSARIEISPLSLRKAERQAIMQRLKG